MTGTHPVPPLELRRAIAADLVPVRPLHPPLRRTWALLPPAFALLLLQPLTLGVRHDAAALGPFVLWGLSVAQALLGLALLYAALREAVPGRALPFTHGLLGAGVLVCIAITLVTWSASTTRVPSDRFGFFWKVCFGGPLILGVPLVALAAWMALRAYPLRPALVGTLAGLGAGLVTDAGWRTFCHVSEPRHVLSAHTLAVVVLGALGALLCAAFWRRR